MSKYFIGPAQFAIRSIYFHFINFQFITVRFQIRQRATDRRTARSRKLADTLNYKTTKITKTTMYSTYLVTGIGSCEMVEWSRWSCCRNNNNNSQKQIMGVCLQKRKENSIVVVDARHAALTVQQSIKQWNEKKNNANMKWTVRKTTEGNKKAKQCHKTFGTRSRTQIYMQIANQQWISDWWRMRAGMLR